MSKLLSTLKWRLQSSQPVARLIISIPATGLLFLVLRGFSNVFITTPVNSLPLLIASLVSVLAGHLYTGLLSAPTHNPSNEQNPQETDRKTGEEYNSSVYDHTDDTTKNNR